MPDRGSERQQAKRQIEETLETLDSASFAETRRLLNNLRPADVAHLIESTPQKFRHTLWQLIDLDNEGDIIQYLSEEVQSQLLSKMDTEEVVTITEGMAADDVADLLQQLPNRIILQVLSSMDGQDRARVEQVLFYDEDSAGGLMNTDTITVRANISLDVALRYLRRHSDLPAVIDQLIVVNRKDKVIGTLPINRLLMSDPNLTVREIMKVEVETIPADMRATEVAALFERHDWISAPVVDGEGHLLGRITIDDVVDVIRDDAEHSLMSMAGLDEDADTLANVMQTTPRRALWLGLNLLTAFIASAVINLFEGTLDKVVALAILMPIVASMGGIAGTQTLTVVIRGMALQTIGKHNSRWLISREVQVAAINGMLWAGVVAVAAGLWFQDPIISTIIAAAMLINLVTAALAGAAIPLALKSMNIDPALAGGVILTTVTDVVGFTAFLGLATVFYG